MKTDQRPPLNWDAVAPNIGMPDEATVVADLLDKAAQAAAELRLGPDQVASLCWDAPDAVDAKLCRARAAFADAADALARFTQQAAAAKSKLERGWSATDTDTDTGDDWRDA
jgi:hypothetical protein